MSKKKDAAPKNEVAAMPAAPSDKGDHHDYEAKDAAETIMRAHEHMANDDLMKRVDKHLDRKKKAISSMDELRSRIKKRRNELNGNQDLDD